MMSHTLLRALFLAASVIIFAGIPLTSSAIAKPPPEESCFSAKGEEALAACQQLLDEKGDSLKLFKRLSDLLNELMRFDKSLEILGMAREKYPGNKRITFRIKLTKSMEAEQILFAEDDASKKAKEKVKQAKIKSKVGRLLCMRVKGDRGLAACEKAIEQDPEDHALFQAYGDLLKAAGREKQAKNAYATAESLQGRSQAAKSLEEKKTPAVVEKKSKKLLSTKTTVQPKPEEHDKALPLEPPVEVSETAASTPDLATGETDSIAVKLRKLKSLYEQQLIDETEYKRRRTALLDEKFGKPQKKEKSAGGRGQETLSPDVYGDYHALVIGIQDYEYLTPLEMVRNDAREIARLLEEEYGFEVVQLNDPTRREMLMALGKMRSTLTEADNLLIYYAGHGWLDRDADTGYWLPVNAASDNDIDWLSLNSVISATRAIPAKHVMIVADSCFSGKLTRGLQIKMKQSDHLTKMAKRKARVVLTSGGLEPVLDAGGGDHSVFAEAFLKILGENKKIIDGTTLFSKLRRMVMLKASQVPEYSDIRRAGHEGGDFIFVRTEKS